VTRVRWLSVGWGGKIDIEKVSRWRVSSGAVSHACRNLFGIIL
jgi:hypothetical protein